MTHAALRIRAEYGRNTGTQNPENVSVARIQEPLKGLLDENGHEYGHITGEYGRNTGKYGQRRDGAIREGKAA